MFSSIDHSQCHSSPDDSSAEVSGLAQANWKSSSLIMCTTALLVLPYYYNLDDYFYPGKDFNDKVAYAKYGTGYDNIHEWRRENINVLISDLSKSIKATDEDVSFGISPFGIWANKSANELGSDTRGMQSYYDQYADTRKWVKEGILDYIAPQLYWYIGYEIADYSKQLYMNGIPVENRSPQGYFGVLVPLVNGANTFTLTQEGSYATRVIYRETASAAPAKMSKGLHNRNFYAVRGTWTPSVLVESGFVPNPYEFEWLIDEAGQSALAKNIAEAVVKYFK